jgi:hypothetical protein
MRQRPAREVSFNPLTQIQTWEPSQEEEEGMNEPRGPGGAFI